MFTRISWCNTAVFAVALMLFMMIFESPLLANDQGLQPEFFGNINDEGLPEAPNFDDIAFFTKSNHGAYVRVDAGFGMLRTGKALTRNSSFRPGSAGSAIVGIGLGYQFEYVLRGDITAEYRAPIQLNMRNGSQLHVKGANVLANLYADIGTWSGVTPYLGIGAGLGWRKFSQKGIFESAQEKAKMIWSFSGGAAVAVSSAITFDVGYRYVDGGAYRLREGSALKNNTSHDMRIGLRWRFGAT